MKASIALALLLGSVVAHATVFESPNAKHSDGSAATEFFTSDSVTGATGQPSQLVQASNQQDAAQIAGLVAESDRSPPTPALVTTPALQFDGSTLLARTLLGPRDFSAQAALAWSMTIAGLCVAGLIVWRTAMFLHRRYTELLEMRTSYLAPSGKNYARAITVQFDDEQPMRPLNSEQVAQFHREGFLVLDRPQVQEAELASINEMLSGLFKRRDDVPGGRFFSLTPKTDGEMGAALQVLDPSGYEPKLRLFSYRDAALALAKQLLSPDAALIGEHAILQPSNDGGITPWHQDEAFRDPNFDHREISVWVAVSDATADNGAVRCIPGSHLGEVLPHRVVGDVSDAEMIECDAEFSPDEAQICPIPAGGMLIHDGRIVHGAGPNRSGVDCLSYVMILATPPVRRVNPKAFPWLEQLSTNRRTQLNAWLLRGEDMLVPLEVGYHSGGRLFHYTPRRIYNKLLALRGSRL